ncbi:hypothetical protein QMN27_12195 [Enterobacter asburiae]|uniref:hypothetical protein n=1 Tax=Enterobacter asburiae TaxID=61645 RepID=UPI002B245151|nr:hypothetical protein [Enterobacter asburiae]MEB2409382.1 hypothetical protein [Enterobacter asburiae]
MITFTKEQLIASAHARIEFAEMMLSGELEPLKERTWSIELELARIALASLEAEAAAPGDVTGQLAHAYKELTPTFMRNHIGVFERYGIYPDGSAGIQAMRIALDGMNRRAAMLQGAENAESPTTMKTAPDQDSSPKNAVSTSGNSPVIPDGWVAVPVEPTEKMLNAWLSEVANWRGHVAGYKAMLAAAPQQEVKQCT